MKQVDHTRASIDAKPPNVTITDFDTSMKAAIAEVYPEAKPQICVFHINKNVTLHIKRKWNKAVAAAVAEATGNPPPRSQEEQEAELDQVEEQAVVDRANRPLDGNPGPRPEDVVEYSMAGLYKLWEGIVYAHTVEDYDKAWQKLKDYFGQQTAIIDYLEETWLPYEDQWAGCHINKVLNFGQRTTSPVESVNRYLKSFVVTGASTIVAVVRQSLNMLQQMEASIEEGLKKERNRLKFEFLGQKWLGKAPYNVSAKALTLVTRQHQIMLSAIPSRSRPNPPPLQPCSHQFSAQFGIPCSHALLDKHQANEVLTKEDFSPY